MSTTTNDRLARLLDAPFLARVVPHLAPETLHQLIQYRGLDACGDLVTSATPAQLTSLLDLDLWRNPQPGRDEQFDVDRFGEWLEVLVDTGESIAARTVAALDQELVIAGLSRYLRVFDPGTFEPTESTDDEAMDRHEMMSSETSRDIVECELAGYLLRARRIDAWDAITTLLVTLETEHTVYFHRVMEGCRRLSNSTPEVDGLDDLLLAPEQHLHDVASERERRRSRHGYASPADARAFLQLARQPRRSLANNPVATAYFRAADEAAADEAADAAAAADAGGAREAGATPAGAASGGATAADAIDDGVEVATSIDAVIELLIEAGVRPERPRALLEAPAADEDSRGARLLVLKRLLDYVLHHDEAAYLARSRELAFLANTLLSGCSVQSRPFTPQEASDAAAGICNLGLESIPAPPDTYLLDHDLVAVFEVGWSVLYQDVSLFVTDQLMSIVANLDGVVDFEIRAGLRALQRKLLRHREAGTPWLARDATDVLAMLDMTAWIGVLGLLDECPVLPAALPAILEGRTTPVSQTAFEFISTTAQIGDIRLFMRMLPGVLTR